MLKVTNGVMTMTVTRGAFESYFKHAGYSIVDCANSGEEEGVGSNHPTPDSLENEENNQEEGENYTNEYLDDSKDDTEESEDGEADTDEVDYSEIPLSELNFDQLIDYADQLKIDHKGVRSKKELRAAIREYLKRK